MTKLMICFVLSLLAMSSCIEALPTSMEKMTISRMRMADLESSATGYVYNSQGGQPASYVQYTNHGSGGYYEPSTPIQYVTYRKPEAIFHSRPAVIAAIPEYNKKAVAHPTGYVVPLLQTPKKAPLAPYYLSHKAPEKALHSEIVDDEDEESEEGHSERGHDDDTDEEGQVDDEEGDDDDDDDDEEEEHGSGKDYHSEEQSSHGEKGEEGYKSHHNFGNGVKGDYHKDKHEGHYSEEGGNKKSEIDAAGHYNKHDEVEKASEGENHGQRAYHKKGHKTTGFHNVYSKDEYKKDTDFYDDEHKSGHYDKHSSSNESHAAAQGGYKKGDHHNSGYDESEKGKSGHHDKGHEHSENKGYKSNEGNDSYHKNHADYATKNEAEERKKYGYDYGRK